MVENNDFGLTFRKNMVALMQKAGKKVVLDVTQDRSDTNWYSTITRIPASKPDLVIVSISAVQAANFVKQYAESGHHHAAVLRLSAAAAHLRAPGRARRPAGSAWSARPSS